MNYRGDALSNLQKRWIWREINDAYSLLDRLAMEYESIKIDPMEIYYKAFDLSEQKRATQTISAGFLPSRDAKDKKAIGCCGRASNAGRS